DELPNAIAAMIKSHTAGVAMYVAQFPEWSRFVENAAEIDFDHSEVSALVLLTEDLQRKLEERRDIAHPEVPKTFAFLLQLAKNPPQTLKRVAFALFVTLENFLSKVYHYAADFLDKTVTKTIDEASTSASKALARAAAVALLTLA